MLVNVSKKIVCLYNVGLKVDTAQEILTVIMMLYYDNVYTCKRQTVVYHAFCFWQFLCPFLALQLTTMSLDIIEEIYRLEIMLNISSIIYY